MNQLNDGSSPSEMKLRLGNVALATSVVFFIVLIIVIPFFVLNYNVCTASPEEKQPRQDVFLLTLAIGVGVLFLFLVGSLSIETRRLLTSIIILLVGLVLSFLWAALYFFHPCSAP